MMEEDAASLAAVVQEAKKYSIQVIPELVLPHNVIMSHGQRIQEDDLVSWVDSLASIMGGIDPAAIVLTIQDSPPLENSSGENHGTQTLPQISKSLTKRLPVIGSVRVMAGQNRMGAAVAAYKMAGFTGSILR
jgi:hypothetical protein